jgi:SAM-dependent methyltransferase
MRAAAERRLAGRPGFESVVGTAEDTQLDTASVDLAIAAQAFPWFDPLAARTELQRVLREPGWVALIWNTRQADMTEFLRGYEALLRKHGTDYLHVRHEWRNERSLAMFFPEGFERAVVPNEQLLDFGGLRGRLCSSSYAPPPGDPRHGPMIADLRALFDACVEDGVVRISYDCEILTGRLGAVA